MKGLVNMILDGKKIAFLGDSITFGDCIKDRKDSYVNRVAGSVCWAEVHNYSLPGSRIGDYIGKDPRNIGPSFVERFPEMAGDMDIVVVFGGTNDFGIGNEPLGERTDETSTTFYGALNILMKGLKIKYPNALIVFMTPLHRKTENIPNEFSGAVLEDYVAAIRERAEVHEIRVLDLYEAESLKPDDGYYEKLIISDGIHPNELGHERIAGEVIQYLRNALVS